IRWPTAVAIAGSGVLSNAPSTPCTAPTPCAGSAKLLGGTAETGWGCRGALDADGAAWRVPDSSTGGPPLSDPPGTGASRDDRDLVCATRAEVVSALRLVRSC